MAIIKNIHGTTNLKKVLPNKIPIKEKWERYTQKTAQRLNEKTKHWKQQHKKIFLVAFCTGFIGLLILSFYFLSSPHYSEKSVSVPVIPQKILLPEKQVLKTLPPQRPDKVPPLLWDSNGQKSIIHSH